MIFLYLLISAMPLIRHPFWSGFAGELTMIKYLGVLCLGAALLHLGARGAPPLFATWQARSFVVLAGLAIASFITIGAPIPWEISPLMSYVSFLLLFFVVLVMIDTPQRLRWVLLVAIASVAYASLHVIREWQKYGEMAAGYRPGWISGDPNYYTISALLCLPLTLAFLRSSQPQWVRVFCLGSLIVTLIGITFAASRGGFLGLTTIGLLLLWRSRRRVRSLAIVGGVVLALVFLAPASPLDRVLRPDPGDHHSAELRVALWMAGLRMFRDRPLAGVGAGNFQPLAQYFGGADEQLENIAHNTYIEIAAELGLPGLLAFLGVLAGSLWTLERARRPGPGAGGPFLRETAHAIQAGLLGYAVAAFFVSAQYQKLFWLLVFLTMCLPALMASRTAPRLLR